MAPSRVARGCGVLMAVGLLDVAIRLGSGWSMVWVVRAEAALFLATSLGLLFLHLRRPTRGWARAVQLGLSASFLLGGLRAALWALGMPVFRANLVIAILAVVGRSAGPVAAAHAVISVRSVVQLYPGPFVRNCRPAVTS